MGDLTIGQFLGFLGPASGYTVLAMVFYLLCVSGHLVTRRESDKLIDAASQVNEANVTNHKEIIRLKDERIALAEGEAERWKQQALDALGIDHLPSPESTDDRREHDSPRGRRTTR